MVRKKRTGKDRLLSTSCSMPLAYLERIEELADTPSNFIRNAVGEKLEREEGFIAAINLQEEKCSRLKLELKHANNILVTLLEKHEEWKREKEMTRVRDIIITEYLSGVYQTELKMHSAVKSQIDTKLDLKKIIHEVWVTFKGENKDEHR